MLIRHYCTSPLPALPPRTISYHRNHQLRDSGSHQTKLPVERTIRDLLTWLFRTLPSTNVPPMDNEHRRIFKNEGIPFLTRRRIGKARREILVSLIAGLKHRLYVCNINSRNRIYVFVAKLMAQYQFRFCIDKNCIARVSATCTRADADVSLWVQWSML